MTVDGLLYQPPQLEPLTSAKDGFYLPTPTASEGGYNKSPGNNAKIRPSLTTMARKNLWPTPTNRDHKGGFQYGRIRYGKPSTETLDQTVQAYRPGGLLNPDPTAVKTFGQLNPQWVEWLMGYEIGHTELDASATAWFHIKSAKRSKN
jgi:hypothetical protein